MNCSTPWDLPATLQNSSQMIRNHNMGTSRSLTSQVPVLPPRPLSSGNNSMSSYSMPYGLSYNSPYNSYGSYGNPYRSSLYGPNYGGYSAYSLNDYSGFSKDDHERRFINYVEENSKQTFASVESVVRAFNSLAMMLDNTFFAMTSSFRAVLGVAENFGRLRTMFGHIWYSINIFRFVSWMYRKIRLMLGLKVSRSPTSLAWKEAAHSSADKISAGPSSPGSSWPTIAFLGVVISAPYIISKFLPKYEDKLDPANWKSPGIKAKACFDFIATSPNELTIHTNDNILLAPTYIQDEMRLKNTGWAYAVHEGRSGVIPLNYIVINKNHSSTLEPEKVIVPRTSNIKEPNTNGIVKTPTKRVSFGNIEIFENDENFIRKEKIPSENNTSDLQNE